MQISLSCILEFFCISLIYILDEQSLEDLIFKCSLKAISDSADDDLQFRSSKSEQDKKDARN